MKSCLVKSGSLRWMVCVLATGMLHGCGNGLGLLAGWLGSPRFVRYAGGATAALGVYLFVT